ncbi:MAG: histidine kinase [Chitinophagaceae bacterium]|nr:histidine kinase [Chitinophagaceae bacterium]
MVKLKQSKAGKLLMKKSETGQTNDKQRQQKIGFMMKRLICIAFVIGLVLVTNGQIRWADYSQSYLPKMNNQKGSIGVLIAIPMNNNSYWVTNSNKSFVEKLVSDSSFLRKRPEDFVAINSFDTAAAHFFAYEINMSNAGEFEYKVLMNNVQLLKNWSPITMFTADSLDRISGMPKMAYLGAFKAPVGSYEVVDIRRKGTNKIIATGVVAWQSVKPIIDDIYTSSDLNTFITRLSRPWKYDREKMTIEKWKSKYTGEQIDKSTGLPKKLFLEYNENNLIFLLKAEIYQSHQVRYQLLKDNRIIRPWADNEFDNSIIWLHSLQAGAYRLEIKYSAQGENVTSFDFDISKVWYQTLLFKIIGVVLIAAFIGFITLSIILVKQQQRALEEETRKAKLQFEIKTIHAQLNPHFVFNALNSIQGLVNKEDIRGANKYLSVFGQLMRNSLANSDKDFITLSEEISMLETYLQLEQLRFGFVYKINVSSSINQYEVEVPSLLLQPLVENSIKHGVAGLKSDGVIELYFDREEDDLKIKLIDNGSGFDPAIQSNGYGLKLTRERINLLNRMLSRQSIQMDIHSNPALATSIFLTFKNWFI